MATKVDIENFIKSLQQEYRPRAHKAAVKAGYRFCNHVLKDAQILCPVDTTKNAPHPGFLKDSAMIGDADESNLQWMIGFNAEYAAAVHECLTNWKSGKTIIHPQGQAKFLETAMRADVPDFPNYVLNAMEQEFK